MFKRIFTAFRELYDFDLMFTPIGTSRVYYCKGPSTGIGYTYVRVFGIMVMKFQSTKPWLT